MLVAKNLIKTFEKNEKKNKKITFNAVDDISISVQKGEIVGILGPNGAGKTTLLRMLGTLMEPTSGSVEFQEDMLVVDDVKEIKRRIGYLSGNTKLYDRLSTRELLQIMGEIYGLSKQKTEERISDIIELLKLDGFVDNRIEKLSTGQTQRAAISRCLIHDPQIYIFDEPTLGLDIISSNAIVEFMKKEKQNGKAVLYSTHYMEEAEYICDRIIMINKGKIIKEGSIDDLKKETNSKNLREIFSALIEKEGMENE